MWRGIKTLFSEQSRGIGNRKVKMGMMNSVKGRNVTSNHLFLSLPWLSFLFLYFPLPFIPSFLPSFSFHFSLFLSLFPPPSSFYLSPNVWCGTNILLRIMVINIFLSALVISKDVTLLIDLTPCSCQVLCFSQMMIPLSACFHGSQQSRQGACVAPLSCSWKQAWHHHLSDSPSNCNCVSPLPWPEMLSWVTSALPSPSCYLNTKRHVHHHNKLSSIRT